MNSFLIESSKAFHLNLNLFCLTGTNVMSHVLTQIYSLSGNAELVLQVEFSFCFVFWSLLTVVPMF